MSIFADGNGFERVVEFKQATSQIRMSVAAQLQRDGLRHPIKP